MARHDRGGGLSQRAGFHVMCEVGDDRAVHLEVDLYGRSAQFRMRGGAGVGIGKPPQSRNIPRQLDDPLVVNVVQHEAKSRMHPVKRTWRVDALVLYMDANAGN